MVSKVRGIVLEALENVDEGRSMSIPPIAVLQWAGISQLTIGTLTHLNDNCRYTFEDIADWIEANL